MRFDILICSISFLFRFSECLTKFSSNDRNKLHKEQQKRGGHPHERLLVVDDPERAGLFMFLGKNRDLAC